MLAPARQDACDLREPGEPTAPIGHVAATSARDGEARDEIRERNLRRQNAEHQGLVGVEMQRQESEGVDRPQPEHGDDDS